TPCVMHTAPIPRPCCITRHPTLCPLLLRNHGHVHLLPLAKYAQWDNLADGGIHEQPDHLVDSIEPFSGEADDDVALPQPCSICRSSRSHIQHEHTASAS